jgi:hypothetical protein
MIRGVTPIMCAYRIRRRSTTWTMAMRAASSPSCGWTQRMPASAPPERRQHLRRGRRHRPRGHRLDRQRAHVRSHFRERQLERRRHLPAGLVSDERDAFAWLNRQAGAHGVPRAKHPHRP